MAVTYLSDTNLANTPNIDVSGSASATGATATASLPATVNKTNVLTGFDVSATGTITAGTVTVTGVGSGTLTYGVSASMTNPLVVELTTPMICSGGTNTAISVACSTLGAATSFVNVYGYQI